MAVQFLPEWANSGENSEILARIADPATRTTIVSDIRVNHADWDTLDEGSPWESVVIGVTRIDRSLAGRTLADIARERKTGAIETVLDIIASENNNVSAVNFAISEEDIATVMRHPLTMIGSDAVGTAPHGKLGEDRVHPRSYGTFPRVLGRYVRELGVISEADAIRKMTSMPADRLGLDERGRIAVGQFADIVVYDPARVGDNATFADAHHFSSGIEVVIVNGRIGWRDGARTDTLAGRVLRKGR
jgi:N-acyl-D-amino-acid deacylase